MFHHNSFHGNITNTLPTLHFVCFCHSTGYTILALNVSGTLALMLNCCFNHRCFGSKSGAVKTGSYHQCRWCTIWNSESTTIRMNIFDVLNSDFGIKSAFQNISTNDCISCNNVGSYNFGFSRPGCLRSVLHQTPKH